MSLQVWLPLNGNLNNQGLTNILITNNGTTVNNNGKIGKAIEFGTNKYIKLDNYASTFLTYNTWSLSLWFKCTAQNTSHRGSALISGGNWNSAANLLNLGLCNFSSDHYSKLIISGSGGWANGYSYNFYLNTWYHVTLTSGNGKMRAYVNGQLIGDSYNAFKPTILEQTWICIGNGTYSQSFHFYGLMNDVRVYDHCLSPKEVEELSKGLVLHYKLDKNLSVLNNCYSNPTFNTSAANGGWSHWGPSGHAGTYSQNTDSQYIYNKANTYSHCVDNTASVTGKYYLCYQSPSFSGGYRSLQFIVKEANGLPITEAICCPGWNARNGGAPSNTWSEIIDLSNGFYLCKVNGLSQDGSNDLVSISVQPGYKIYISEGYLENDRELCSDIFNQDNLTTIYDCSGYGNNGTVIGTLNAVADSPRYEVATVFNGTDSAIKITNNNWCSQGMEALTINIWAKASSWSAKKLFSCTETGGFNTEGGSSGYLRFPVHVYTNAEKTSTAYKYDSKEIKISDLSTTDWVMITFVYDTTGTKTYINGELHHTYSNTSYGIHFNMNARLFLGCEANTANPTTPYLNGQESDFRIYATALSAAAIKELYDTSASIDASGNMYARELVE